MGFVFNKENFEAEVLNSSLPVVVDFYADWCGPCKMMAPIVDAAAASFEGKVKVGKLNVDDNQQLAMDYNVMTIPTFIVFKDGKVVESFGGGMNKADFEAKIQKVLS